MSQNIFSVCISAMQNYFKLATKSKLHAAIYTALTILIVAAVVSPFLLPTLGKGPSVGTSSAAAVPAQSVPLPKASPNPPPVSPTVKRRATRKPNVTQITLGDQSSNINDVKHDVTVNYGATEVSKKLKDSENQK
jgi:hypothetical protein